MSEDFLNSILKTSTATIDEKIKKLSMVLDKIMEVAVKSISGLEAQVLTFETMLMEIETKTTDIESKIMKISTVQQAPQIQQTIQTPLDQKPVSKPTIEPQKIIEKPKEPAAPLNPRMALQSELKSLFSKRKR